MLTNFHKWFDSLEEPNRFLVFLFGGVIPFVLAVNLGMYLPLPFIGIFSIAITLVVAVLVLSRVRYIHRAKRAEIDRRLTQKGFSLIEVLIIVAIILIIAAIVLPHIVKKNTYYSITTPQGTFTDTGCMASGGVIRCDNMTFTGTAVLRELPRKAD